MSTGKSKPYAILVFGAPKSGKTSFAEHFSQAINAPFLNLTHLINEYHVTKKLAAELIAQIAKSRSTIIIEGLIDTEAQRREMRQLLIKCGYQQSSSGSRLILTLSSSACALATVRFLRQRLLSRRPSAVSKPQLTAKRIL